MAPNVRRSLAAALSLLSACGSQPAVQLVPTPAGTPEPMIPKEFADLHLIPFPEDVTRGSGSFLIGESTTIQLSDSDDAELLALGDYAAAMLRQEIGQSIPVSSAPLHSVPSGCILLRLDSTSRHRYFEAYELDVTDSAVVITAGAYAGLFYGLQTLRQLIPLDRGDRDSVTARSIPALRIEDRPRFVYRGMHLDVGRHFFPVSFIKRYIDLISMYKMNTFHWHLTEDQGWRLEIKRYPRLTQVGAYRRETILEKNFDPYIGDGVPYGGFYTQDEVRDVVRYARQRYVTVIPEIEMPGHSTAALAAYPELACTEGPFEVATEWGVHDDIYCPKEETFEFLENVLTEVMELFPSPYIHIGGDEVPKRRWEESEVARALMEREGLADEGELQSYFIRRIERFLLEHNRRLIGWDEILEGGLAPEATVMSWRGMQGGVEAARQGHDVIMTPTSHVYFDYYQGDEANEPLAIGGYTPLEQVYEFDPVPAELTTPEAARVLGAQGNVWTEYMKTGDRVEYMVFPRALALSEVVWSATPVRDWEFFKWRLRSHLARLDRMGVRYRPLRDR